MAEGQYSTRVAADHVLRVQPAEGTTIQKGQRVTLVPSLGPRPVPVPDVTGKALPKARDLLRDAGLHVGKVRKEYDERIGEGLVVSQSVDSQAEAPIGSDIDLVLSKGPTPVPVPKVVGLIRSEAAAALQAKGFLVSVSEEFSEKVDKGVVISQTPAQGTEYQPGNSVSIVVSKGPPEFAMPSVVGMSRVGGGCVVSVAAGALCGWVAAASARRAALPTSGAASRAGLSSAGLSNLTAPSRPAAAISVDTPRKIHSVACDR